MQPQIGISDNHYLATNYTKPRVSCKIENALKVRGVCTACSALPKNPKSLYFHLQHYHSDGKEVFGREEQRKSRQK